MKSVLLEYNHGSRRDQRIWIRLGEMIRVGSGEPSDVVISEDRLLGQTHLAVGHSRAGCFIECLDPDRGMKVNGKPMQRSRLHDGDVVIAGGTEFRAIISGETTARKNSDPQEPPSPDARSSSDVDSTAGESTDRVAPREDPAAASPASRTVASDTGQSARMLVYGTQQLSSVVWHLFPKTSESAPLDVIIRLLASRATCMICGELPVPESAGLASGSASQWKQLDDKLHIGIVSAEAATELVRSPATSKHATLLFSTGSFETVCQTVVGQRFSFRNPGIYATQISVAPAGIARRLLEHLTAVLMVDQEGQWQIFTSIDARTGWPDLGLPNPPVNA
jgi:hypothetical protein